jgi:hypothetical protein
MNILKELDRIGWFREFPPAERVRLERAYASINTGDPTPAFQALAVTSFDPECIEGVGPDPCSYYSIVTQLASVSYGIFTPNDVKDALDPSNGIASISFEHGGKLYECTMPFEDDWVQQGVIDLINQAIRNSGKHSQFLPLPLCDQTIYLVLVPPDIFDAAIGAGLVPQEHLIDE